MRGPKPKNIKCLTCDNIGVSRGFCKTCYARQRRHGLEKLEPKELPAELTKIQQEVLIGSLLGDGCLFKYKPTHKPYFCVLRKNTDNIYAKWEANILQPFVCNFCEKIYFDNRTSKQYQSVSFRTHRTNVFEPYYGEWYPKGMKIVPETISLTPLILAVWFCDDGCVRPSNSPWRMRLKLSTNGFTEPDVRKLAQLLCDRYDEYFAVNLCDGQPVIFSSDNGTRKFIKEIDVYLPPGMDRKTYWRMPEAKFYQSVPPPSAVHIKQRKKYEPVKTTS